MRCILYDRLAKNQYGTDLFSELARKSVIRIKDEISTREFEINDSSMRAFREDLIFSKEAHHKAITETADFYSLGELRELLFHMDEHRFTIPQINEYLGLSGLKFCGLQTRQITSHF